MTTLVINLRKDKRNLIRGLMIGIILCLIACLMPVSIIIADELGGYVSEKLIGSSLTGNSEFTIGNAYTNNSLLDIVSGIDASPTHVNASSPVFQLNQLFVLLLMAFLIILLIGTMANGEINIQTIIIAAIAIFLCYAFVAGIQTILNQWLIGS